MFYILLLLLLLLQQYSEFMRLLTIVPILKSSLILEIGSLAELDNLKKRVQ